MLSINFTFLSACIGYKLSSVFRLHCKLLSEEPAPARKVMDPSIDNPDRHDLYDPRNPLNMRKRGALPEGGDEKGHHKRPKK